MKILLKIVVLIVLLVGGFVAYVFLTLDPQELGQRVVKLLSQNTGLEVTAERFEVRPLQGIDLEGGSFQGELESGSVSGSLDRMILEYELLPILKGEIVVHHILVEGPDLQMVSQEVSEPKAVAEPSATAIEESASQVPSANADAAAESGFVSAVSISGIRVTDGSLEVSTVGSELPGLRVEGLDLELGGLLLDAAAPSPFLGLAASGGIEIDEIGLNQVVIMGGRGKLELDHGRLALTDLGLETVHASLEVAELSADLTENPSPYRLEAGGSYDLDSLVEADGDGFGPAALELDAAGVGPDVKNMTAEGTFRLEDGQIPAFPMMVRIEKLLGRSVIVGHPYEGTHIVFSIADGKAVVEPFVMGFENLQMAAAGSVDLAGPINMQIDIRVPREVVANSVLDPFIDGMTDADGWTSVPFNIGGTMAEPEVDFDMTSIRGTARDMGKRAVTSALDGAVEELKKKTLGRLRKQDDG